jgi:hypothetical protein
MKQQRGQPLETDQVSLLSHLVGFFVGIWNMNKSPGFWFFTGDWLKDPELRFCSIFARGLLVDLLCYMFEAKEQGCLVWPNGEPRTNEEIANAISGGELQQKIDAIEELVQKGVLSRDQNGVLYSRRLVRLKEISECRKQSGSKGGSKRQANAVANGLANEKQNAGVTVSDSVSDSDSVTTKDNTPLPPRGKRSRKPAYEFNLADIPDSLKIGNPQDFYRAWATWIAHRQEIKKPITPTSAQQQLKQMADWGMDRSIAAMEYTIRKGWQGLQEPEGKDKPDTFFEDFQKMHERVTANLGATNG